MLIVAGALLISAPAWALASLEKALAPEDRALGKELGKLANLLSTTEAPCRAELLYRRWVAIT